MTPASIELTREVPAVLVPSGQSTLVAQGTKVTIVQSLGGSHTVITAQGMMVRIDGRDADALGMEPEKAPEAPAAPAATPDELREHITQALRKVYDPEIPVNVVELGLVYGCHVDTLAEGGYKVVVDMTLTAPGCGMGDVLRRDALKRIQEQPGVKEAEVKIVLDPPWDKSKMSDAARLQLGMF